MTLKQQADALRDTWKSATGPDGVTTHDYTQRGPGHDIWYKPIDSEGIRLKGGGWGYGLKVGDFILLSPKGESRTARYRVEELKYMRDPQDQWFATLVFDPRPEREA